MVFMAFHVYLRKGIAYVPVVARVTAGYYLDQEPVAVVPISNPQALRQALKDAINRGNPNVPRPSRTDFSPPILLKYAGVKYWRAFARGTASWRIEQSNSSFKIVGGKESGHGGWIDDPEQEFALPPGSTLDNLIDRMLTILQETAHEQRTPGKTRS